MGDDAPRKAAAATVVERRPGEASARPAPDPRAAATRVDRAGDASRRGPTRAPGAATVRLAATGAAAGDGPGEDGHAHGRGAELGRYVVLAPLGAGGMGEVYTAYDPALDRRVALKVIRPLPEVDGGSLGRARNQLLAEAQALAKLSHPNVVHVYDVGTLGDDVYIAMEFIDGVTLRGWLREPRPWAEIIARFVEAGRGLEAAHAAHIVHRDFKPDNVLIGKDGRARVIDFGIALGPNERADPDHALGPRSTAGTPGFMAPEQFQGEEVGPAADQFSFAVSLYEALWKQHAFAGDSEAAIKYNVVDGNVTPPPASPVPPRVRDAILRALARAPAARHPSMAALLDAIAPAPRRARAPLAIAGGVAALAVAGVIALAVRGDGGPVPCTGFDDDLAGVWDPARKQAVRAQLAPETWPAFERALDAYGQAWIGRKVAACRATVVTREQTPAVMERRMSCLDTRRRELDAAVTLVAAGGGPAAKALELAGGLRALAGCDNLAALAPAPTAAPEALHAVEDGLAQLRARRVAGEYKAARAAAAEVIAAAEALAWGSGVARALVERGLAEASDADPTAARETLFEAVRRGEEAGDVASVAGAWVGLVDAEGGLRKPSEALRWAKHAEIALAKAGGDQELQGELLHNQALALRFLDRTEEGLDHERRALALLERAFGPDHVRVAVQRGSVANMLRFLARWDEARAEGEAVLAQLEALVGPNHIYVANALNNLALAYDELDRLDDERRALERAIAIRERAQGPDHGSLANPLMNVVALERRAGRHDAAEALWQRAVKIRIATLGPNHPDVTRALAGKLIDRVNRGLDAEARLLVDEVITRHRARNADAVELSGAIAQKCELQRRAGDLEAAAESCRQALAALGERPEPSRALFTLTYAARVAAQRGDGAEAAALLARAQEALPHATRDKPVARGYVGWAAAHVAAAAGRRDEARTLAREAIASLQSHGKNFDYVIGDLAALR